MSLATIQRKLSREEMKQIRAGVAEEIPENDLAGGRIRTCTGTIITRI